MVLERLFLAVMLGLPVAAAIAIPRIDPGAASGRTLAGLERVPCCAFRHFTGIPCPLCGLTRSFVSLGQGRIRLAFTYHLLGPPLFVIFAGVAAWSLAASFRKKKAAVAGPDAAGSGRARRGNAAFLVIALLFIAAWAVKLALVPREFW